jgi:hypothetical protein
MRSPRERLGVFINTLTIHGITQRNKVVQVVMTEGD